MKNLTRIILLVLALGSSFPAEASVVCEELFKPSGLETKIPCGPACVLNLLNRERTILVSPSSEPRAELQNLIEVFAPRLGITSAEFAKGVDANSLAGLLEAYFKTQGIRGRVRVFGGTRDDITYPKFNPANTSFRRYVILKYDVFSPDATRLRPGSSDDGWIESHFVVLGSALRNNDGTIGVRMHDPSLGLISENRLQPLRYSNLGFGTYEIVPENELGERAIVTNVITFEVDSNSGLQY